MDTYTASEIVEKTGGKLRPLMLWADAGAIQAIPMTNRAGSGVHRRFAWPEVRIAAALAIIAPFRLPIGVMVQIGEIVRAHLLSSDAEAEIAITPMAMHPPVENSGVVLKLRLPL